MSAAAFGRLAGEATGDGPPIVLLHGLASTRVVWRQVVPRLAATGRRVVAVDVPGFGASPPAGPGFALRAVAAAIDRGLRAEHDVDGPYELVGHSMGGAIALVLAAHHPDRVRRVVLFAPAGLRPYPRAGAYVAGAGAERLIALRRAAAGLSDVGWGRRVLLAAGVVDPEAIPPAETRLLMAASAGATRVRHALAAVAAADLRPLLAGLQPPLALLWGDSDRVIPPAIARAVLDLRPDVPHRVVPRTGHLAMVERPDAFAAALLELLDARPQHPPPVGLAR